MKCAVESATKFLEAICLPLAQEFGLLFRDKVYIWRLQNTIPIIKEAEKILTKRNNCKSLYAHPRIAIKVIQEGSCVEDLNLQHMWGGLLASSCTEDGSDETNLIFVNILSQLSSAQARMINYWTPESMRRFCANLPNCNPIILKASELREISGLSDPAILVRELSHLGSLGLLKWATRKIRDQEEQYEIRIEDVTLRFCARCNGYSSYMDWVRLYDRSQENLTKQK
ncbi:MAG: hypothetical protein A2Y10_19455 [Planctomycetes bacterium GWF2_41_51]|nr:MAG: hypothetical protein A2Y10_19455 [Planctomycetes bacterium GWF2_41_51]